MSNLTTLTTFSGITEGAYATPVYLNSKFSQLATSIDNLNTAAGNAGLFFNVKTYGAIGDGVTDDTTAIQAAITAAQTASSNGGATVFFPYGDYKITTALLVTTNYTKLIGEAPFGVRIRFAPTANGPAIKVANGATAVWGTEIRNFGFYTADTTYTKEMIRLSDVRFCRVENIFCDDGVWTGAGSIGLRVYGREYVTVKHCRFAADKPILIETNPNLSTNDLDMSIFEGIQCVVTTGQSNYNIMMSDGQQITNTRFTEIDCSGGIGGISWVDLTNTATVSSYGVLFDNIRCEQMNASENASFKIWGGRNANIQFCRLAGLVSAPNLHGISIRSFNYSTIRDFSHSSVKGAALDVAVSSSAANNLGLSIDNLWYNSGSSLSGYALLPSVVATNVRQGTTGATVALNSTGTIQVPEVWTSSGISVGTGAAGGTLIPAISSTSSLIAPFVVNGSSSSFTIVVWAAARANDIIMVTPTSLNANVSSLSSGIVLHSHCTQNGQVELRISNCSTLVQNVSQRTYFFTRISPF